MTFLRRLAEYEPDDIDEKLTGMQPDTLDELRAECLARQDREDDHAPHTSTPAPWVTPPPACVLRPGAPPSPSRRGANPLPEQPGELMYVEMVDPQRQIMAEIADKRMTRDDVALTYAFAIRQHGGVSDGEFDYAAVNRAIMDRWSLSALKYIKEKAWRLVTMSLTGA